ncbi:response regulator [Pseudodesulfovibrio cashew]|uniref:histidine kinase n=1 Tax=Pseudodesulfovibrio cashew TaxID=2678688 RepID=A0A6I6JMZ0_9BACT|nr:ATP-binding protein [Pseudodesulfovibrio cashew]QGY39064.1 response regulator [Pseudodesulfovibrio cashew]
MRIPAKYTLTFGFSGLIIILAALIILSSTLSSKAVLARHARTIMANIASYTIDKSQSHLDPARKAARLTLGLSQHNIVSNNDISSMVAYFYEQLYLYPQFSGIYFGSSNGEFVMASRYNQLSKGGYFTKIIRKQEGKRTVEKIFKTSNDRFIRREFDPGDTYDPRTRPWFRKAVNSNALIWTDPYIFFTSKKPGITTANPVYDAEGRFVGVIGVDIEIDKLSTFISKLNVSEHGRAFILSRSGDLIAHADVDKLKHHGDDEKIRLTKIDELDDTVAREALRSLNKPHGNLSLTEPVFTSFTLEGEKYNAMFAPFVESQWPWIIGIYMPEDDYLGAIKKNSLLNILIAVFAVGIALSAGLMVARKLNTARETAESAGLAKSQFLARMSHEIRTPLNAILGAGELLAETKLDSEQRRLVAINQSAGEHLRDLVSAVLDISKIEAGRYRLEITPFDLYAVTEKACRVFTLAAREKGIDLKWTIEPGTPERLMGDPTVFRQILVNLLGNAVKFTHEGAVRLSVNTLERRTYADAPDEVVLECQVEDTGIGVTEDQMSVIFERFTQADGSTSRKYGGSGLGLSISRNLARLMGGELTASSRPGKGSAFRFTAPFTVDDSAESTQDNNGTEQASSSPVQPRRVLLVEDDERNRLLFSMFLMDIPHTLETAESGEEALKRHFSEPFDLIFMDIEMPGMDGYQTTEAIRAREAKEGLPPVPVVAVTAHALLEAEEQCARSGCTGYLPKPLSKEALRQAVDDYLKG